MAESPFKGGSGVRRLVNALGYSLAGLKAGWRHEAAVRQLLVLAVIGIALACHLPLPAWARMVLVGSHLLCIIVELINSAIEAAVDHTSLERHPLAKRAKDLGSAAQLVGITNLVLMWLLALLG